MSDSDTFDDDSFYSIVCGHLYETWARWDEPGFDREDHKHCFEVALQRCARAVGDGTRVSPSILSGDVYLLANHAFVSQVYRRWDAVEAARDRLTRFLTSIPATEPAWTQAERDAAREEGRQAWRRLGWEPCPSCGYFMEASGHQCPLADDANEGRGSA